MMLFPHDCDTDSVEAAVQVNGCPPVTLTVKVAGVVSVDIPSAVVTPARVYDTPDPVGILFAAPTTPTVSPDGIDTCDGQVVAIERDSNGSARLFVKV